MPVAHKPKVQFVLSIDTEEEWDWNGDFPEKEFSLNNVFEIPAFQLFCQDLGVKPTYLVDYAVANDEQCAKILKSIPRERCEIGAHLHPWANPPFFSPITEYLSHVINIPVEGVEAKLKELLQVIETNIGIQPRSFRTGRWGINGTVIKLLEQYDFEVDSSVYPLYHNEYFSCESAPSHNYWPALENTNNEKKEHNIFEIPVTCGFNRSNYVIAQKVHKLLEKRPFTWLKANGFLWHTLLLRKLYLSPELCSGKDMNRLIDNNLSKGNTFFHMYLHSSSLISNVTGLHNELNAREAICQRIAQVIKHLSAKADIEFLTLTEAKQKLTATDNVNA
jgi:peptidoglycan/xylan/chitin deacetylase (PgdA/CDA1 family)